MSTPSFDPTSEAAKDLARSAAESLRAKAAESRRTTPHDVSREVDSSAEALRRFEAMQRRCEEQAAMWMAMAAWKSTPVWRIRQRSRLRSQLQEHQARVLAAQNMAELEWPRQRRLPSGRERAEQEHRALQNRL